MTDAAPTAPAVVQTMGLRVRLGGVEVVRDVDLAVEPGTWISIIGPNGAGKSTVLRAIAGLVRYQGSVRLGGVEVASMPGRLRARSVAVVPQMPTVPAGMKVGQYVLLGRIPHLGPLQREGGTDHAVVRRVLAQLGLTRFAERTLTTMSGGELQRVFLARALAQEPTVLLLDEPTTALDIGHSQDVLDLVGGLRARTGLTVMSTMHDLTLAGQYSDRLVLLNDGAVVAAGPAEQVLAADIVAGVYHARVRVVPVGGGPTAGIRAVVPVPGPRG